jgi:hypothetical protein
MARNRLLNFDKVQKDFLSAALKATANNIPCEWFTGEADNSICLSDGHFIAFVPREMCFVAAAENSRVRKLPETTFKNMIVDRDTLSPATYTNMQRTIPGTNKTVNVFTLENGEEAWLNEKYVKYFEGMGHCKTYGTTMRNPIYFYVMDRLVGMILPINHN